MRLFSDCLIEPNSIRHARAHHAATASVRILFRIFTSKGPSINSPMACSKFLKCGVAMCLSSACLTFPCFVEIEATHRV